MRQQAPQPAIRDSVYESRRSVLGPRTPQGPLPGPHGKVYDRGFPRGSRRRQTG